MAPVSLWERVKAVFAREASDVKEGLHDFGESLDAALARKERELAATPSERLDMVLEDVDAANAELDALTERTAPAAPPTPARPVASHQLLEPSDVSPSPQLETALQWVTVEPTQDADPMSQRCGYSAWLEHGAVQLVDSELLAVAAAVGRHPLVVEVAAGDTDVLYVDAPGLHQEDVRLLVAAALAERLPDEGGQRTTPPDPTGNN